MRKIVYLLLTVLWGLSLVGCATGGQNPPAPGSDMNGRLTWLEELNISEDKFKDPGEIDQAWEIGVSNG
ncbi:hypothetical protein [Desulfoscipio gibsoniae]|uniref:Uncharacterized protein n=1 Tax=Desulfoscipio gibsoniae DSM 7213 TaxID=767817 RepID=R4KDE8_9FIRM|nr:hypothetical protein [Desulfoscipio gibsoniae]AGL00604.1 hypothetical protein Desgi_1076 [Desulfoscipio gibsoniae DSM 7213]